MQEFCKKKLQGNFLARFDQNLTRKLSYNFFLQEKLHFSARLARYVQDLVKILQVLHGKYLQDLHISCKMVFTGFIYVNIIILTLASYYRIVGFYHEH